MLKKILAVIIVIIVVAAGVLAYSFFRTPEEASRPIDAIPITTDVDTSTPADASDVAVQATEPTVELDLQVDAAQETTVVAEPEKQAEVEGSADTDAATAAEAKPTMTAETQGEASSQEDEPGQEMAASPVIFEIIPDQSQARFLIDEVLRGAPITVVGATDQVAGQLAVHPNDLSNIQVGIVQVNARTLATDNEFRNRAIKNQILLTNDYEFVTFTPTELIGLPESGAVGDTYTFQVVGDLTITDVTRQVTFDVVATATSETRIEGTATTAFPYTDFELFIPDAPAVDTVDDEVRLELEFVAEANS